MELTNSEAAWFLPLPKEQFTMPMFSFGQPVRSLSRETIRQIIGMEFAPDGSTLASEVSSGWHYVIAVTERPNWQNWRDSVESIPEADMTPI